MQDNAIIGQTLIRPSESINATLQVSDILLPISMVLHFEPQSSNVALRETVVGPDCRVVNTNEFLKDFFTTFRVNTVGKFTLTILNQGITPVNVDGIFGYIQFVGQNNQINLSPLNRIGLDNITKMAFGYNDLVWIISVIAWTMGVTTIILYIIKRRRRTGSRLN